MKRIKISATQRIAKNVFLLSLDYSPSFIPGQVIELTEDPDLPPRLYSICSAPGNKTLDILFDLKELGRLTPILARLKKGDSLWAGDPSGDFVCSENEPAYWIAAGTGIAPFASMFLSGNRKNKVLIHGGRTRESFYFEKEFRSTQNGRYIRCCTSEEGKGLYKGRLTQWLKEQNSLPKEVKYYLCGSAEMVVQTRDILVEKGIDYRSIIAEIYF